jgi:hypothetical protein
LVSCSAADQTRIQTVGRHEAGIIKAVAPKQPVSV